MNNLYSHTDPRNGVPDGAPALPTAARAPQHEDLSTLLGLIAGDGQRPHEGERDIVASAIWLALQSCGPEELPNLSKLLLRFPNEIQSRMERARGKDMPLDGNVGLVPLLALCAEIHRTDFVNADGKQARCLLFLALVDLAIHCPELIPSTSFVQAANGLRILLERLVASPTSGITTHHFSVWQLFDWVAAHRDFADYVKRSVRNLRERFLLAWRAFEVPEASHVQVDDEDEEGIYQEISSDEAFWVVPESSRFEVELPVELKRKLLATELTRITAMSRFASASLLIRSDEAMTATVAELVGQAACKSPDAPHALAKLMSIAGGVSMDRVYEIRWASPGTFPETPPYPGVLTADARWLIRSEFNPRVTKATFHARSVHIPIPESLASLLREQGTEPNVGEAVLRVRKGNIPPIPREASAWETTLASRLMRDTSFGLSLAQHVLHTSFGLDAAPLYYDRISATYLAHAVAQVTHPWFACSPRPHAAGVPTHSIGSQRVVTKDQACTFLRSLRVGWSENLELWERIQLRSRNLRYGILLSVAHRTNESISNITTRSIARNEALATVADKAVSIDHPHRLAALGTKVIDELDRYLAELHEATRVYPGTQLACAAARILAGEQCLFLVVCSVDSCHTVTLEEHVAEGPAWAAGITNWLRQYANDGLAAKVPESLRVAQMGWTGTRPGAISELSLQSPLDALSRVRRAFDDLLKYSGWTPLPASGYGLATLAPAPIHWTQAARDHERTFQSGLKSLKQSADAQRRSFAEEVIPAVNAFFRANAIALEATIDGLQRPANDSAIELGRGHHAALLRTMGAGGSARMLARELLHMWLSHARRSKVIAGPLPRKVVRTWPRHSAPFVFDAHHSLEHRDTVVRTARDSASLSLAARTLVTTLLEGWVADVDTILQLMQPGAALHELKDRDVLLVEPPRTSGSMPALSGCVAFTGAAATALRAWHRGGQTHAPDRESLQAEIYSAVHPVLAESVPPGETLAELETLMRSYWGLRAAGIIRDVVLGRVVPMFAPLGRVVALHEDQPIWPENFERPAWTGIRAGTTKSRRMASLEGYEKVKGLLLWLAKNWSPAKDAQVRQETITSLRLVVPDDGARNGAHVMALYAAAYLAEGLRKEQVRPVTVQDAVYSVGSALIQAIPEQSDLSRPQLWQAVYARAIQSCAPEGRLRLVMDLAHFQKVMTREHDLPAVSLSPLLDALDLPAPPEIIGFLTHADESALISMALHRVHAAANEGSPLAQMEALCGLAICAIALSTNLRDREFRVPRLMDWQTNPNGTAQINLHSNGQDFVKSPAGRRAIYISGSFADIATSSLTRISVLKSSIGISPSREKLFSPAGFAIESSDISDVMRRVNIDIRYVTGNSSAAIDITRKTWALAAFRGLVAGENSLWSARDLLSQMGHVAVATMQAHYLHDPLAFLERIPRERSLTRTEAGWILGMNPKAAQRLLCQANSWLRPSPVFVTPSGGGFCELDADPRHLPFEPSLRDAEALLHLLAEGRSVQSAMAAVAWPGRIGISVERALTELRNKGVALGGCEDTGHMVLAPPSRAHSHPSLDACRLDAFSWSAMAWIFDQWLADWRARDQKGVAAHSKDWEEAVMAGASVFGLPWHTEELGHMTFYHLDAGRKNAHSPWPAFRWLALCAWIRQRILTCPLT